MIPDKGLEVDPMVKFIKKKNMTPDQGLKADCENERRLIDILFE